MLTGNNRKRNNNRRRCFSTSLLPYGCSACYHQDELRMKTTDFDYHLPPALIAQQPARERTRAKMMIVRRSTGDITHGRVSDLPDFLNAGDLLVVNNTRVIPARLFGYKEQTGGRVELLLIEETGKDTWTALVRSARPPANGARLILASGRIRARVLARLECGGVVLKLSHNGSLTDILEEKGVAPLPPYIRRPKSAPNPSSGTDTRAFDMRRYQTVYAEVSGAVAAPTAGLHFTRALLHKLKDSGVRRAAVTLHVGPGTFKPVKTDWAEDHEMEEERYVVSAACARSIGQTRKRGGRIVAVGTTVARTLETVASEEGDIAPARGRTSLFVLPPYRFRAVDAMLTNFHLPKSTLLMMVSAFAGIEVVRRAYSIAIENRYRFYSYGDCMLML